MGKLLHAVYDLGVCPITYDVTQFYVMARIWARRCGFDGYKVSLVAGDTGDGFRSRTPKDKALSYDEKMWRLRHILLAHEAIAKDCHGVSVVRVRSDLDIDPQAAFPSGYMPHKPVGMFMMKQLLAMRPDRDDMDAFAPSSAALLRVSEWLANVGAQRPVSLTVRTSPVEGHRNSRADAWQTAADYIQSQGYDPIIVPDHDAATAGMGDSWSCPSFVPGALDLDLRVALYRFCEFNMCHNGGPGFLPFFMGASQVAFLPVDNLPLATPTVERMAWTLGVKPGESWPFSDHRRRFVWQPDTAENVCQAFDRASQERAAA